MKRVYTEILIATVQIFWQNLKVDAYGPVSHENQTFNHQHAKARNLLNIHFLLLFPYPSHSHGNFTVMSLGFICYYTASKGMLFWL